MKKAFTLIVLLIVVAIIAILAAIAVPNFLEAQTRSKVARAFADIRTISLGMEAYSSDNNNKYPFDWDSRGWPWYVTDCLSTPIAYINSASILTDLFRAGVQGGVNAQRYRYVNYVANMTPAWLPCPFPGPYRTRWDGTDYSAGAKLGMDKWGQWKITSAGPDKIANTNFFTEDLIYDPSNGTISGGDIIRSQKYGQRSK
ncbi:MAG: hypothetical protein WCK47_03460 [bacterium]